MLNFNLCFYSFIRTASLLLNLYNFFIATRIVKKNMMYNEIILLISIPANVQTRLFDLGTGDIERGNIAFVVFINNCY